MTEIHENQERKEKVILIGVSTREDEDVEASLCELAELADTAGAEVLGQVIQNREAIHPGTYIGKGKLEEVRAMAEELGADGVICDDELTPAQLRGLEERLELKVMDRTLVILDIFAKHASTSEGKLQVEMAQLSYRLARLSGLGKSLSRLGGGIGTRGPGEKKLETDRRLIRSRMARLRRELSDMQLHRDTARKQRLERAVPVAAIVGYTNAGKSTLLNALTGADILAQDQLFATLDPTLRTVSLDVVGKAVFADTVGFIRHLPHDLIAAFKSTLEETVKADLLLHIIDAADKRVEENIKAVNAVLKQIGADEVPTLLVFNKADLLDAPYDKVVRDETGKPVRVNVSAKTGSGLSDLLSCVSELLSSNLCTFTVKIYPQDGKLRSMLYESKAVSKESYADDGSLMLELKILAADAARIDKKTAGRLGASCVDGKTPWITPEAKEDLDLDLVFDDID